jgi:hypothetical protein
MPRVTPSVRLKSSALTMRYFVTDYPPLHGQEKKNTENLSEQSKTVNRATEEEGSLLSDRGGTRLERLA